MIPQAHINPMNRSTSSEIDEMPKVPRHNRIHPCKSSHSHMAQIILIAHRDDTDRAVFSKKSPAFRIFHSQLKLYVADVLKYSAAKVCRRLLKLLLYHVGYHSSVESVSNRVQELASGLRPSWVSAIGQSSQNRCVKVKSHSPSLVWRRLDQIPLLIKGIRHAHPILVATSWPRYLPDNQPVSQSADEAD